MPTITYVGPHDLVEIAATGQVVAHGDTVDVDDALAASLCEQTDNWTPVAAARGKAPKE